MKSRVFLCCLAPLLLFGTQSALSTVFIIPNGDIAALKNAIIISNSNGEDDAIELASNGTYVLTIIDNSVDNEGNGLPVIENDGGRTLVVHGNGATIQRSTNVNVPLFRILYVQYADLSLSGVTIANGALALQGDSSGGGIYNNQGNLVLNDDCVVRNNQANSGAGIASLYGPLIVTNCTISHNIAGDDGAGIAVWGYSLTVVGSSFSNNSAGSGGGIYNLYSDSSIKDCVFVGNHAGFGGAVWNEGTMSILNSTFDANIASSSGAAIGNYPDYSGEVAMVTVVGCKITNNSALSGGGGIYNTSVRQYILDPYSFARVAVSSTEFTNNSAVYGGAIASYECCQPYVHGTSQLNVTNSTFSGNSARDGGGIYIEPPSNVPAMISNSTFVRNTAYDDGNVDPNMDGGGAIYCRSIAATGPTFSVTNCTLSENRAPFHGGGIFMFGSNANPKLFLDGTILKSGRSGENMYNSSATITSQGYNLSNDNGGGFLNATGDQTNANPMLDSAGLRNNGGPTPTIALLPGSPAINSGNPNAPARDQRYYLRNGAPDKGAFEYGGTISPLSIVSRKTHGAAGTFDVDLPLNGNTGVECRSGGGSGNHQLILTFATPVTIGSASVTTGTGSVSNISISGSQVTLDLTGVANAQQIVLTVSGVNDGANSNYVIIPMRVLLADTTANSTVNASDVSQTKAQVGQAVTSSNFRMDVNLSGTITASDVTAVKSKVGTVIPIP